MNFQFSWKAFNVVTGQIEGMYNQIVFGENITQAVLNWSSMHGELCADEDGIALEILGIKEVTI